MYEQIYPKSKNIMKIHVYYWLKDEHSATKRIIFTYPMVAYTDMEESLKTDVLEICTNACEKYINDNQSVSCCLVKKIGPCIN